MSFFRSLEEVKAQQSFLRRAKRRPLTSAEWTRLLAAIPVGEWNVYYHEGRRYCCDWKPSGVRAADLERTTGLQADLIAYWCNVLRIYGIHDHVPRELLDLRQKIGVTYGEPDSDMDGCIARYPYPSPCGREYGCDFVINITKEEE